MKVLKFLGNLILSVTVGVSPLWAVLLFIALLVSLIGTFAVTSLALILIRVGLLILFLLAMGIADRTYGKRYFTTRAPAPSKDDN